MKTKLLSILLAVSPALPAADATPPCCAPAPQAAAAACCAAVPAPAVARPVSDRSIYLLGSPWTTDGERPLLLAALRGRPVVLAMFFAQCEYACPVIVNDIKRLRAQLPAGLRERAQLVLVSFDPVRDTPAALRTFRARMGLDAQWTLLRGEADAVQELAMLLGVKFKQDARGQFAHSNVLTLLNAEGEVAHQLAGLNGDVSESARILERLGARETGL